MCPDIAMCANSDCPQRHHCRRSEASGTQPSGWQSWMPFEWRRDEAGEVVCDSYWPTSWAPAGKTEASDA